MKNTNSPALRAIIIAALSGSLEMYDFVIYIFFASIIATLFFPQHHSYLALISTLGIFALGYLARPLGGIIFGYIILYYYWSNAKLTGQTI